MSRLPILMLVLLGGVAFHGGRGVQPAPQTQARASNVPRQESARAQLKYAVVQKRKLRGKQGKARDAARQAAVEAYRAVRRYWLRDRALVAEASFRAGELLRSAGHTELALAEFAHAQDHGKGSEYRPRAGLEIGHIHRRGGRLMPALASYEAVEALGAEWPEQRDLAAYWQGRAQLGLQRPEDARRCFERAACKGVDPIHRIRAYDAWSELFIDLDDLEGAAGVLEQCRKGLAEHAKQKTTLGMRVRASLDAMRSPSRLVHAVQARRRRFLGEPPMAGPPP